VSAPTAARDACGRTPQQKAGQVSAQRRRERAAAKALPKADRVIVRIACAYCDKELDSMKDECACAQAVVARNGGDPYDEEPFL